MQPELRTLNQTLIVKQNELTHAYQDATRSGAELVATRKELRRSEHEAEKAGKARDELQTRSTQLEASAATLSERLEQLSASRDELWQLLQNISAAAVGVPGNQEDSAIGLVDDTGSSAQASD